VLESSIAQTSRVEALARPGKNSKRHKGATVSRPPTPPGPGHVSVWDYPRPPRVEESSRYILVRLDDLILAETRRVKRVLETSLAPSFYIPRQDVAMEYLISSDLHTICEWKGRASYFELRSEGIFVRKAAWTYENPTPGVIEIRGHIALNPNRLECFLDGERVQAQVGGFYGGWISPDLIGPFKGDPGTRFW
jgi:uncharacterized protein (DUF427 family)